MKPNIVKIMLPIGIVKVKIRAAQGNRIYFLPHNVGTGEVGADSPTCFHRHAHASPVPVLRDLIANAVALIASFGTIGVDTGSGTFTERRVRSFQDNSLNLKLLKFPPNTVDNLLKKG